MQAEYNSEVKAYGLYSELLSEGSEISCVLEAVLPEAQGRVTRNFKSGNSLELSADGDKVTIIQDQIAENKRELAFNNYCAVRSAERIISYDAQIKQLRQAA